MKSLKAQYETMARTLENHDDFRVLRRLGPLVAPPIENDEKTFIGIYLDVEATGLDTDVDEVIELCMYPFTFTAAGRIASFGTPLHSYRQPNKLITEEITKITGITNDMVKGHRLRTDLVHDMAANADLIIAHHAGYDRPMMERIDGIFATKNWGCSMSQVPWEDGKKLGYVLASLGRFYKAHNAVNDCEAGLFALQTGFINGKSALAHVLDATREPSWHVWAVGAHYDTKDTLKARKYFWDPDKKLWHKEIKKDEREAEENWLRTNVYNSLTKSARFDAVTAKDRFTKRG